MEEFEKMLIEYEKGMWIYSDVLDTLIIVIDQSNVESIIKLVVESNSDLLQRLTHWCESSPKTEEEWDRVKVYKAGLYVGNNTEESAARKRAAYNRRAFFLLKNSPLFNKYKVVT